MECTLPHIQCTLSVGLSARHLVFTCTDLDRDNYDTIFKSYIYLHNNVDSCRRSLDTMTFIYLCPLYKKLIFQFPFCTLKYSTKLSKLFICHERETGDFYMTLLYWQIVVFVVCYIIKVDCIFILFLFDFFIWPCRHNLKLQTEFWYTLQVLRYAHCNLPYCVLIRRTSVLG